MGTKFKPEKNNNSYRFGVDRQDSLGSLTIQVPTPKGSFMALKVDVVPADVPFLIGLDVLDHFGLTLNSVENSIQCPSGEWEMPVVQKLGHAYIEWGTEKKVMFTKSELLRLHRGFQHPADNKLLNLLKLARPEELDQETRFLTPVIFAKG